MISAGPGVSLLSSEMVQPLQNLPRGDDHFGHLENEVAELRREVAEMRQQLAEFRKQFE